MKRHQLAHIESKPYTCRVCDRQFTWLGNFHKHCATHAPSTPHFPIYTQPTIFSMCPPPPPPLFNTTPYSNPAFYFSSFPARPPMSHFGGCNQVSRVLQCSICRLTFTTSRALKMHTRIHSGEKPYKCDQCNKAFARKDELHTHKYFHTGNDGLFLRFYFMRLYVVLNSYNGMIMKDEITILKTLGIIPFKNSIEGVPEPQFFRVPSPTGTNKKA